MKKLTLMTMVAIAALLFTSCGKAEYSQLVGTWGTEKIEYYNIDYWGNPIPGSGDTYVFDYDDPDNGIQLIFRDDKTGEMRDSAIDTIYVYNEETQAYDSAIYCPDTTLVTTFTCSYDKNDQTLYMNMSDNPRPYRVVVTELTKETFIYENEYGTDIVEKAYMRRISKTPTKSAGRSDKEVRHPHKKLGTMFGRR